jgi:putative ATPase
VADTIQEMVACPICGKSVKQAQINAHIDSNCAEHIDQDDELPNSSSQRATPVSGFFQTPLAKRISSQGPLKSEPKATSVETRPANVKRSVESGLSYLSTQNGEVARNGESLEPPAKRTKTVNAFQQAAPLAERMRPRTLDDVCGQDLVGPTGVLRGLIEQDRVPSMILWGGAGTGKTTIARVIATMVGSRFVEINSTSSGVAECKKIFAEAKNELGLTGRKTIIFCDEIHRFSKSQQDVFLGPVESGQVTLIGATTENPSFKVQNALLSRCRTFTLQKLTDSNICDILNRALREEGPRYEPSALVDDKLIKYLAAFADGDARTALNLLELAMELSKRRHMTQEELKRSLTKTLVYDRAGDQHYDTISAFHKSIRGGDPDAALYYLARMLQSGEDALYIARRLIVVASEDIGLADNTMLPLAIAAYTAAEKVGLPEARINLAHATVAFALSKKSTRAYRGLSNANAALQEPGIAGLPIPIHLRNAPTKLMKELGYGKEYKYNPNYVDGKVVQEYLPEQMRGRRFLEDDDLGNKYDCDLDESCTLDFNYTRNNEPQGRSS